MAVNLNPQVNQVTQKPEEVVADLMEQFKLPDREVQFSEAQAAAQNFLAHPKKGITGPAPDRSDNPFFAGRDHYSLVAQRANEEYNQLLNPKGVLVQTVNSKMVSRADFIAFNLQMALEAGQTQRYEEKHVAGSFLSKELAKISQSLPKSAKVIGEPAEDEIRILDKETGDATNVSKLEFLQDDEKYGHYGDKKTRVIMVLDDAKKTATDGGFLKQLSHHVGGGKVSEPAPKYVWEGVDQYPLGRTENYLEFHSQNWTQEDTLDQAGMAIHHNDKDTFEFCMNKLSYQFNLDAEDPKIQGLYQRFYETRVNYHAKRSEEYGSGDLIDYDREYLAKLAARGGVSEEQIAADKAQLAQAGEQGDIKRAEAAQRREEIANDKSRLKGIHAMEDSWSHALNGDITEAVERAWESVNHFADAWI